MQRLWNRGGIGVVEITCCAIHARPHGDGYQLLLDTQAGDALVEMLAPP